MQVGRPSSSAKPDDPHPSTMPVPDEVRARIGAFADINAVRTARSG